MTDGRRASRTASQPPKTCTACLGDLSDGCLCESESHALRGQQHGLLLDHVVLRLRENAEEVLLPADQQAGLSS